VNEKQLKKITIVLFSFRTGVKTGYQYRKVQQWKAAGVTVDVSKRDAKTIEEAHALVKESSKLGPVGGLFNLAMVSLLPTFALFLDVLTGLFM
jgi:hypothetical protein